MAPRFNPLHDHTTRLKIKTSQLINRLQQHAKGEVEMTTTQVRAAEILLRKVLPDLATVELQAGDGGPILIVTGVPRSYEPGKPTPQLGQSTAEPIDVTPSSSKLTH